MRKTSVAFFSTSKTRSHLDRDNIYLFIYLITFELLVDVIDIAFHFLEIHVYRSNDVSWIRKWTSRLRSPGIFI